MSEPDSVISDNMFTLKSGLIMYFCPFCGGKLPDSSKPIYAPHLTAEERARLEEIAQGISSPEEAIAQLGVPDYDAPMLTYLVPGELNPIMYSGPLHEHPTEWPLDTQAPRIRNMELYELSKIGDIEFYFTEGKPPHWLVQPKCIPPRHLEEGEQV